jgi:glycogen operon protein
VGSFIGSRWKEWNGHFRDDVRSFVKGDRGTVTKMPLRLLASPDLYGHEEREPEQSINFVTAHDGFTLNDLVSYNRKHNEANKEGNRDGHNHNLSWNCGVEGPTDDQEIERLRQRQVKNFFAITLLALGMPMLLMGDEVRRTQQGNNNAYCQDNQFSWFDWSLVETHQELHRFVRQLIHLRRDLNVLNRGDGLSLNQLLQQSRIEWHGVKLHRPDWGEDSHSLAMTIRGEREMYHLIFNAYWEALEFDLPPLPPGPQSGWQRVIDTALESPEDCCERAAPIESGGTYRAESRSVVLLVAELLQQVKSND